MKLKLEEWLEQHSAKVAAQNRNAESLEVARRAKIECDAMRRSLAALDDAAKLEEALA